MENLKQNLLAKMKQIGFDDRSYWNDDFLMYNGIPIVQMNQVKEETKRIVTPLNEQKEYTISNETEEFNRCVEWMVNFKGWYFQFKYYWLKHKIRYFFTRFFKSEFEMFEDYMKVEDYSDPDILGTISSWKEEYFH